MNFILVQFLIDTLLCLSNSQWGQTLYEVIFLQLHFLKVFCLPLILTGSQKMFVRKQKQRANELFPKK